VAADLVQQVIAAPDGQVVEQQSRAAGGGSLARFELADDLLQDLQARLGTENRKQPLRPLAGPAVEAHEDLTERQHEDREGEAERR